ncbi:MAG: hypothetical protein PUC39_05535 [Lachnospiraceae bacterium]|nr:hypothetical protein [Lachnospiraceae bacterium]
MSTSGAIGLLIGLGFAVVLIAGIIGVAYYVLFSYPLYQLACRAGMENAWLAWIPVARMYVLCMLSQDDFVLFGQWKFPERSYGFVAYVVMWVLYLFIGGVPIIGGLLKVLCSVAIIILVWRMSYDFIRTYGNSGSSTEIMVLSIFCAIFGIVLLVVLWIYRNNEPNVVVDTTYDNYNNMQ